MRRNVSFCGLLLAWLCANGALLDAVQVFAWGKMFAGYAQTMSAADALQATFDPAKRCHLCIEVATLKESTRAQAPAMIERSGEKVVLAIQQPAPVILIHLPEDWPATLASAGPSRKESVAAPPPRV